jgi:hypothetical protein
MLTLGTWIGPIIGGIIVAVGIPAGLLRIRTRRGRERERLAVAVERLAAAQAQRYSEGYDYQYPEWLAYFTGRRKDAEGIVNMEPPGRGAIARAVSSSP